MSRLATINVNNEKLTDVNTPLLVLGMSKKGKLSTAQTTIDTQLNHTISQAISLESYEGKANKMINVYGNDKLHRISLYGLGEKMDADGLRASASQIMRYANTLKLESFSVDANSFALKKNEYAQAFAEGLILGAYQFLEYKSKNENTNTVSTVTLVGDVDAAVAEKGEIIARGVAYARDLGNHPANELTPTKIAADAVKIASDAGMKSTVFDVKQFEKMGLGSFYGVARGAETPAKMIIVEYSGGKKTDRPFALVGKGLTFDSGGISIKPSAKMDEMKFDMCGSAVVMGVMHVVAELRPKINIVFAIGSTENMPDADAQRPGDIVKAYNGKTIEVLNTDAEGRLVLADVLSYVEDQYNPVSMLDFATLTGAVLIALGDKATGIMGNDEALLNEVKNASAETGEKVWELPLWDEYTKDIESKVADVKNIGNGRLAGTITAGSFLKEFVDDTPWCHFDIAGTAWGPKEPAYQPKNGATGVAVRLVYNLLEKRAN
jgi:leucyl aminopeptidase